MRASTARNTRTKPSPRALVLSLVIPIGLLAVALGHAPLQAEGRQPIYVGAHACAACHDGVGMGHQYSRWLLSRHAQAYASLSLPESLLHDAGPTGDFHLQEERRLVPELPLGVIRRREA